MEINTVWRNAIEHIMLHGEYRKDKDGRKSREIMNLVCEIADLDDIDAPIRQLASIKKWIYPELEELEAVMLKGERLSSFQYTYGERIFNYAGTKNQVDEFIVPLLKNNPESRKAFITLHNPLIDSTPNAKETPSLVSLHFRVARSKLNLTATFRSQDMFIGWPANIYQLCAILVQTSSKLELSIGNITTIAHCAHIYEDCYEEMQDL